MTLGGKMIKCCYIKKKRGEENDIVEYRRLN